MEEGVNALLCDAQKCIRQRYEACEQFVRKSPGKSMLGALAAGYLLHRLPIGAILGTQVRLLSALAPPALFVVGAAKVCEFLKSQEVHENR